MNYLENTKLALRLWNERVTPAMVVSELNNWSVKADCGSQACFGGHLAMWPEFQGLGVQRSIQGPSNDSSDENDPYVLDDANLRRWLYVGEPFIPSVGDGFQVAEHLFGAHCRLFAARGDCPYDHDLIGADHEDYPEENGITDYRIVQHRLERHIAYLESKHGPS